MSAAEYLKEHYKQVDSLYSSNQIIDLSLSSYLHKTWCVFWKECNYACTNGWGLHCSKSIRLSNLVHRLSPKTGCCETRRQRIQNEMAKNAKWGGKKLNWQLQLENMRTTRFGRFMKLFWRIHEVARGKGPLSCYWLRCATCQVSLEESKTNLEGSWNC